MLTVDGPSSGVQLPVGGRAEGHGDAARRQRGHGLERVQAGDARDRSRRAGAAVRERGRHHPRRPARAPLHLARLTALSIANVGVVDVAGGGRARADGRGARRPHLVRQGRRQGDRRERQVPDPGLWDAHVHLAGRARARSKSSSPLAVTAVRDLGGHLDELDACASEIEAGTRVGPRIWRAGPILNGASHNEYQRMIADADEARATARELSEAGVDFLKTHRRTSREAYFALIDEGRSSTSTWSGTSRWRSSRRRPSPAARPRSSTRRRSSKARGMRRGPSPGRRRSGASATRAPTAVLAVR